MECGRVSDIDVINYIKKWEKKRMAKHKRKEVSDNTIENGETVITADKTIGKDTKLDTITPEQSEAESLAFQLVQRAWCTKGCKIEDGNLVVDLGVGTITMTGKSLGDQVQNYLIATKRYRKGWDPMKVYKGLGGK